MSVLTLGDLYTKLKERFDQWSDDASSFMEREEILFPEQTHLDCQRSANAVITRCSYPRSLAIDFQVSLPGGEFHGITDPHVAAEVEFVPKSNVAPERDFAVLDRLLSEKPNASYIALESLLLYSHNKTSAWLMNKTEEEKRRLFGAARSLTSVHRANFKQRREEIEHKRLQLQLEQRKHAKHTLEKLKSNLFKLLPPTQEL